MWNETVRGYTHVPKKPETKDEALAEAAALRANGGVAADERSEAVASAVSVWQGMTDDQKQQFLQAIGAQAGGA